jgi:hypothetical protein
MSGPASVIAVTVWCGFCQAGQGTACAPGGQHLDRYLRAYQGGLIGRDKVAALCAALGPLSAGTLVPDAPTPAAGGLAGPDVPC